MAVYLPEEVFSVCTNQMDASPKKLLSSDLRDSKSVMYGVKNKVFLVRIDKKINSDFKCKTNWSSGAGMVAMGGGVAVGLGLAASCMAVPGVGWVVGGIIAVGCLAYGLWQMSQRPSCSEMIGFEESQWKMHHNTVRFDSASVANKDLYLVLTKKSMLSCKEGGVLLPFISKASAKNVAESISTSNNTELTVNIVAGAITGVLLGFTMGMPAYAVGAKTPFKIGAIHVFKQVAIFGGWMVAGHYLVNPAATKTGEWSNSALSDGSYDHVKEQQASSSSTISPTSNWDPLSPAMDTRDIKNRMAQNNASQSDLAKFDAAIAEAERQGTYSLKNNPMLKEMITRIKAGEFGLEVKEMVLNKKGDLRGKINRTNINNTSKQHSANTKPEVAKNKILNNRAKVTRSGGVLALIAPFIGKFFAERAIRIGAEEWESDITNGITVNALDA